jgi:hypothetical protein
MTMQRFPFLTHRTIAQVDQTEKLLAKRRAKVVAGRAARRLDELLDLRDANNPPPTEPEDDAA